MVAAVLIDPLRGRPILIGPVRVAVIIVGVLMVVLALAARRPRLRRATVAFIALGSVGYGSLLIVELVLAILSPPQATRMPLAGLRWRVMEDPQVGFRSTPGWSGVHDDGIVRAEYHHNSRGDRDDDEPVAGATRRILLLGDSFTYGQTLTREETIERRIEARAPFDAYNLGVSGYAAIHSLRRFEQSDWWRGDDVIYLFFNNDIHSGSREWDYVRVYDGYAVNRRNSDGTALTDEQLETQRLRSIGANPNTLTAKLSGWLALSRLRKTAVSLFDRELRLTGMPTSALDPIVVDEAVRDTLAMRAHAEELGAKFHLIVLPAPIEGGEQTWSQGTGSFITGRSRGGPRTDRGSAVPGRAQRLCRARRALLRRRGRQGRAAPDSRRRPEPTGCAVATARRRA